MMNIEEVANRCRVEWPVAPIKVMGDTITIYTPDEPQQAAYTITLECGVDWVAVRLIDTEEAYRVEDSEDIEDVIAALHEDMEASQS